MLLPCRCLTACCSCLQFSVEETRALVEEAANAGTYVCAHAYSAQAIRRALECGVRSIEHGNVNTRIPA
jgi:imidazolonepropionase-like amidohydrolase